MSASEMAERYNLAWAVNGQAVREHDHEPLVTLDCGQTLLIRIRNQTQWAHPIHLHGFHFQVLAVDASAPRVQTVRDTITVAPMSSADIAFVADNPGDWMFHCHVVQHQVGGMMGTIRVV
jgi:FtsP/CotA-like multicopper oxidase with cupredoxin domain